MTGTTNRRCARPVACVMALLLVAACSAPAPAPESAPVRLRVLMTDDWGDRPAFLAAVRDFEEQHDGVRVDIDKLPIRNMAEAVRGQIAARDPVDVVQWHAYAAGAQGLAEPLDELWEEAGMEADEFFPGAVADVRWGERLYGVPLDINALVLFYRPELFAAAGLTPPGDSITFGDLERYGLRLTSPEGGRRLIAIANSYWAAYGWIRANGGELVRMEGDRPQFTLDAPQNIEALGFLARLVRQGWAFAPAGATSSADALALFRAGLVAMHASGSWDLAKLAREQSGTQFGAATMPAGLNGTTSGSVTGGSSMFVPKGSKNLELAFEFMRTVIDDEHALALATKEGRLPVRPRLYQHEFFQEPALQVVLKQLQSAEPLLIEAFPEAAAAWEGAFDQVMRQGADPAQALRAAQQAAVASGAPPAV